MNKWDTIFSIKNFAITSFCNIKNELNYLNDDFNIQINKTNGDVRVHPKQPIKHLYSKSHGSGTTGITWYNHHKEFYNFSKKNLKGNILEIGAGENSILNHVKKFNEINNFYCIGKNISLKKKNTKIKKINNFFNEDKILKIIKNQKIDCILHSHLFEHIYNPKKFLNFLYKISNINCKHIISVPDMFRMVKNNQTNVVFFEHPFYYDLDKIKQIFSECGFKFNKNLFFGKGHSIMIEFTKIKKKIKVINKNKYKTNLKLFKNLFNKLSNDAKKNRHDFKKK